MRAESAEPPGAQLQPPTSHHLRHELQLKLSPLCCSQATEGVRAPRLCPFPGQDPAHTRSHPNNSPPARPRLVHTTRRGEAGEEYKEVMQPTVQHCVRPRAVVRGPFHSTDSGRGLFPAKSSTAHRWRGLGPCRPELLVRRGRHRCRGTTVMAGEGPPGIKTCVQQSTGASSPWG